MNRITAVIKLTRIEHSLMLVIAVVAAELISGYIPSAQILALSVITPVFISMGSFAINDYFDVEADRANKRMERPIVSGAIKKKDAFTISIACLVIGVAASALININAFLIALIFAILAVLYSYRLKDMLLLGNIYIAFSMVIPFIYGNYVVSSKLGIDIVLIGIIIFLAGLAREIHGMIRDFGGDMKARKSKNLVYRIGTWRASQIAFILYAEAIFVSVYAFFFYLPFAYNLLYIIPIAVTDIMLAYVAVGYLMQKKSKGFFDLSRNVSLFAMGIALISFLASAVFYIRI
jgi:geranylgeranylglycerol-phosphate geranylgeranyltransferase